MYVNETILLLLAVFKQMATSSGSSFCKNLAYQALRHMIALIKQLALHHRDR